MEAGPNVIATAGHVDHGKSSLVRALTGREPDRLPDERRRGLTLDLGFAWFELPGGRTVAFVDVPGHERYVPNALAGLGPAPLVLLAVATNEGWMPQTEEHLAIVHALGATHAVVVVTKSDLVDPGTRRSTTEVIRERLDGTSLAGSPIVEASAVTGEGLGDVTEALDAMVGAWAVAASTRPQIAGTVDTQGSPRLWVDRVFTVSGAGTVVTGTLLGGSLRTDDEIELLGSGVRARIRELQSHDLRVQEAFPISRVAVNLRGLDHHEVTRGDHLGLPGSWHTTRSVEVALDPVRDPRGSHLPHRGLSDRGAHLVHVGTAAVAARLRVVAGPTNAEPRTLARLTLEQPLVLATGDRGILRDAGRARTVAGVEVLDATAPSRTRRPTSERLTELAAADVQDREQLILRQRGAVRTGATWSVSDDLRRQVCAIAVATLRTFHRDAPGLLGCPDDVLTRMIVEALRHERWPSDPSLVSGLLADAAASGVVRRAGAFWSLPEHTPTGDAAAIERLYAAIAAGEPRPPGIGDLTEAGFTKAEIDAAIASGRVIRIAPDVLITDSYLERGYDAFVAGSPMTVSEFRTALGTSRRYAVPILEYLDRKGLTRREGGARVLARSPRSPAAEDRA